MLAADIAAQKVARSLLDDQNASEGARFAFHGRLLHQTGYLVVCEISSQSLVSALEPCKR